MTLVVGFRFANQAIIGADSRSIEQASGNQDDGTEKVYQCPLGLVAAAGELNTVRAVFLRIAFDANPGPPAEAIGPATRFLVPDANDPARTSTQWLATSVSGTGDAAESRLSWVSAANNFQPITIGDGAFHVLYPDGMTQAQKTAVETALNASLADALAAADADERREIVLDAIHAAITSVAAHNRGVSARIQVGIHDSVGTIRISNIATTVADLEFPDDEGE
jgi:hypothetical protein